ncbi:MAG: hypothetical protein ACM359_24680 [Bacillota bacterium]
MMAFPKTLLSLRFGSLATLVMLGLVLLLVGGCGNDRSLFDEGEPEESPALTYKGLAGQKCAILVWADSRIRSEYNQVQVDLGRLLVADLAPKKEGEKPDPTGVQFIDPRSVVRFQREHPEFDGMAVTQVAPKLGAARVIYVEISELQTQSPRSILLLSGYAKATLRVVEVYDTEVKIAFEEPGITVHYPHNAPAGVVPNDQVNEQSIYQGTLTSLASKLAARLKVK